jgi:malonyl-CoA O-methyltransferase
MPRRCCRTRSAGACSPASTILDAGSGTGNAIPGLAARYPRARILALDLALAMTRRARNRRSRPALSTVEGWRARIGRGGTAVVCGDIEQLPLAAARTDLIWSNLALQWVNEPPRVFAEFQRVLAPAGLVMFSTFGPDTLKELRAAYAAADGRAHVHRFIDMHDIGDMLVRAGFADPVLTGKALLAAVERNYEGERRDGRLPATFEVIYGHAWKPRPRVTADGKPIIAIKPIGEGSKG